MQDFGCIAAVEEYKMKAPPMEHLSKRGGFTFVVDGCNASLEAVRCIRVCTSHHEGMVHWTHVNNKGLCKKKINSLRHLPRFV